MRVSGKAILDMAEVMRDTKMETCIWEPLTKVKLMVKVIILGMQLARYMMVNGLEGKDMDMVFGKMSEVIATLENGDMVKL